MTSGSFDLPGFTLDLTTLSQGHALPAESLHKADAAMRARFKTGEVGFYDLPKKLIAQPPECVLSANHKIRSEYEAALILGIGGSYLGAASAVSAVGKWDFPLAWVSNIDPPAIRQAKALLAGRKTATVVISKSGNTTETLAALYHFANEVDPKGIIAITDPSSGELRKLSKENGWAAMEVPPNIGGRFSVLTPVGLLPCALGGVDILSMIRGAALMRDALDGTTPETNPAYVFSSLMVDWDHKGHGLHYLMPYWSSLRSFSEWFVQLWGESLAKVKEGKRSGPTAVCALGTTDQHSLLQVFKEGPNNKVIGFIDVKSEAEALSVGKPPFNVGESGYLCRHTFEQISSEALAATQKSLEKSSVPTYRITVSEMNAETLGALYFFFETATAFAGELYGVNPFNQPGVEDSKRLLHAALK